MIGVSDVKCNIEMVVVWVVVLQRDGSGVQRGIGFFVMVIQLGDTIFLIWILHCLTEYWL
jgi:hypothetical protein